MSGIITKDDGTLAYCQHCGEEYNDSHALKDEDGNDRCPFCKQTGDRTYYDCQHGIRYLSPIDDDYQKYGKDRECGCGSRW